MNYIKNTEKKILSLIKSYWKYEILGLTLTIIYSMVSSITPLISQYLIDGVIQNKSINYLMNIIIIFVFICLIQPVIGYFKDIIFLKTSELITYNLREKMVNKILFSSFSFFYDKKKGEIISKILNDCQLIGNFLTDFFVVYITNIVTIVIISIGMLYLSAKMTIIILIFIILIGLYVNKQGRKFKQLSLERQKNFDNVCIQVNKCIEYFETIKSFVIEKKIKENFDKSNNFNRIFNIKIMKRQYKISNIINASVIIMLAILFSIGIIDIKNKNITVGTLVGLTTYLQLLIQPALELANNQIGFQKIIPIYNRIDEFIKNGNDENLIIDNIKIDGDIKITNLFFKYPNKEYQLKNINMNIERGEIIAIVGKAGAGKSTLINLLLGFYKANKGSIKIDNRNIEDYNIYSIRKQIGYVPQKIALFDDSILENIRCYDDTISYQDVVEICEAIGIDKFICSLKDKYNTRLSEQLELSGGQMQMISVARALVKKPKILICDEPTSSLDTYNEKKVMDCIWNFKSKCTIIIISHKLSTIKNIKKVYKIENNTLL